MYSAFLHFSWQRPSSTTLHSTTLHHQLVCANRSLQRHQTLYLVVLVP
jgi:hypothetical protein